MNETSKSRRYQFSLKTLLVIMTLIAVGILAYIAGYQSGYRTAKYEPQADYIIWKSPNK